MQRAAEETAQQLQLTTEILARRELLPTPMIDDDVTLYILVIVHHPLEGHQSCLFELEDTFKVVKLWVSTLAPDPEHFKMRYRQRRLHLLR